MRFALIGLAAAMVASGCDVVTRVSSSGEDGTIEVKGPQTTKSESLSNLSGVSAGEVFTVDVTIGGKPGVTLDAPKDLLPHITIHQSSRRRFESYLRFHFRCWLDDRQFTSQWYQSRGGSFRSL